MTLLATAPAQQLIEWMRERRSIRRYRPEPLPAGMIKRLLDAARSAAEFVHT